MVRFPYITLDEYLIQTVLRVALTLSLLHVAAFAQANASEDAEQSLRQGMALVQSGDYKAAIENFTQAIQLNPRYAEAYYQRGLVLLEVPWKEVRRPSSPDKDFERAIELNPKLVDAYIQLGVYKKDLSYLDRIIAINPGIPAAYYHRGQIRSRNAIVYLEYFYANGEDPENKALARLVNVPIGSDPKQALAYVYGIVRLSIQDYTSAIRLKPDHIESYVARGLAYMRLKELDSALSDFTSVVALDPKQVAAYMLRGITQQDLGNHKAAIEDFTQVIALAPENVEAYEKRGRSRFEAGDKNGAIDDYIQVVRHGTADEERDEAYLQSFANNPKVGDVYYEFGMIHRYRYSGDNDWAIKSFNRALELNPSLARAYYQRGLARFEDRQVALSIEDFDKAIRLMPGDADSYFSRAQARFEAKDYAGAATDYTEVLRLSSEMTNSYYQRGLAYSAARDWKNAITDFTESIKLNLQLPNSYYGRAVAYDQSGDKAKAISDYRTSTEKSTPKQDGEIVVSTEASDSIASIYYRGLANLSLVPREQDWASRFEWAREESHLRNALADFTEVLRLRPNLAEAYYQRARARLRYALRVSREAGKQQLLAKSDLDRALVLRTSFAEAHLERGLIYCASKRMEKCMADLSRAIEIKPRWARAYYERGRAYEAIHRGGTDYRPAFADYDRAIKLDPDYLEAYDVRRFAPNSGLADLAEIIRLAPYDVEEYRWRGYVRLEEKDYSGAIEDLTRAIELYPGVPGGIDHNSGKVYYRRGLARYELGDGRGAYDDYRHYRLVDRCPTCKSGSSSLAQANEADTIYQRGISLSLRGDKSAAKENLVKAAKLFRTVGNMKKYHEVKYQIDKL